MPTFHINSDLQEQQRIEITVRTVVMHMMQYVSISQEWLNPAMVCVCITMKLPITSDAAAYISPLLEQTTIVTKLTVQNKANF